MRSCSVRTFEPPYPPTRRRESTRAFPSPSVSMETAHQGRVNSKGYKEVYKKRPKNSTPVQYRVTMQVSDLGWVDLDFGCSTLLLGSR